MAVELTLAQAKKNPACFMYLWADESRFLRYLDKKAASIIRAKKANQKKVLQLSAEKYKTTFENYQNAIRDAFKETYGMLPYEALVALAEGKEVAGKNWQEGVYGVGSLSATFKGVTTSDGGKITVDANTGHIMLSGKDVTDESRTTYKEVNGSAVPFNLFYTDDFGYTYMSQYNSTLKKYYAESWSDESGNKHSVYSGKLIGAADGASIWGNIGLDLGMFKEILQWILSLFGINTSTTTELLTSENTLPSQTEDGFVIGGGTLEAGGILLALAAGGALLATSGKKNGK